jgi:hypothetical protein
MRSAVELWRRLPVVVRAVLAGGAAAAVGTVPWARLVSTNVRHGSALPWAVPIMAVYLVLYWRYLVRGKGWPQSTADARRVNARANVPLDDAWGAALFAGLLGLVSILLLQEARSISTRAGAPSGSCRLRRRRSYGKPDRTPRSGAAWQRCSWSAR